MRQAAPLAALAVALAVVLTGSWPALAQGLSDREANQLKQQLAEAVQRNEWGRAADIIPDLARANDKKTWDLLVNVVERAPAGTDCPTALRAAAQVMPDRRVQDAVKKTATKSKSVEVRRQLALHVAAQQDWTTLIELMGDKDEQVAATATWKLVDGRVEAAVEPMLALMERLDRTHEGIWDVLRNGLGILLGQRLESAVEYRSKWTMVKEQGGLASVHPAREEVEARPDDEMRSGVRLFGRAIECTRIVFILDVSGSMTAIDPQQREQAAGSTARGGGDSQGEKPKGKNRLERAQAELKSVLSNLPASTKVNIVTYSSPHSIQVWRSGEAGKAPDLHAMSEANKRDACAFVDRFQAAGTTATDIALQRAFEVDGARCFYLLSDGFATHDGTTQTPTSDIIAVIDAHRERRVTIHTLGFIGADREMMIEVARHTGGKYSDIR
ncbi:MAG: VWA domain-containing protein [Planctomycetes bacterium]|nr:VWA domain-containing protein [Planctomycetota bacterium]